MPKVSLIVTVYNEEKTIEALIASIAAQTRLPNEIVVVDGGSTDTTVQLLKKLKKKYPTTGLRMYVHPSNRSAGRNFAIARASADWIACTDAGCVLEEKWLEELLKKQLQTKAQVVAGYYKAVKGTPFQEAVAPYALVMPDKVDSLHFLPATRSMLFHKQTVVDAGGFDELLTVSEDYALAHVLKKRGVTMQFAQSAVVIWEPRKTVYSFFTMVVSMAKGDAQGKVIRAKVLLVYLRYFIVMLQFVYLYVYSVTMALLFLLLFGIGYSTWSILKNKKYVPRGYYYLPILQIVADVGVMMGTILGIFQRVVKR